MANHGAVLVGASLPAVMKQVEYLEYLCDVQLRAGAYGAPVRLLDEAQLAEVTERLASYGQEPSGT